MARRSRLGALRLRARRNPTGATRGTKRDQLGTDEIPVGRERDRALDGALQLLHVPRPGVAPELRPCVPGEGDLLPRLRAGPFEDEFPISSTSSARSRSGGTSRRIPFSR